MTEIRSVRVFSAAKVNALLYGILGLLIAPFLLLGPGFAMAAGSKRPSGVAGLIVFATIIPLVYAAIGFIAGALLAFLYNAIAHSVGGLEVELELTPAPAALTSTQTTGSPSPAAGFSEVPPSNPPEFE